MRCILSLEVRTDELENDRSSLAWGRGPFGFSAIMVAIRGERTVEPNDVGGIQTIKYARCKMTV